MVKGAKMDAKRDDGDAIDLMDHNETVGALVRDLYLEYRRSIQRELQALNVSLPQWTFLRILWREDGLTQKDLSHLAGIHPSTAVDTLRTMGSSQKTENKAR